jgi:glycosyltransferase involved in cell wall biosynthesis
MYTSKLVSVIIPIYNVEKYVEKCIDSILEQTYKNIEVILVNDGSTDRSGEIIQKYIGDKRCIILDKRNGGLSSARNTGLKIATGEYIYFVDSDDYIDKKAIEMLVKQIINTNADFCCYRVLFINEEKNKHRLIGSNFSCTLINDNDMIIKDAFLGKNIKTTVWLKLFKHDFLTKNNILFEEGIINEDCLFTRLCAIYAERVAFLNTPLYYALEREGSITRGDIKREYITDLFITFDKLAGVLIKMGLFDRYKTYYYASYCKQMLFCLVHCAFRIENYNNFLSIYSELNKSIYFHENIMKNIKMVSIIYYFLYILSLYPYLFHLAMKFLRRMGIKRY